MEKIYISAEKLLVDSFTLAFNIFKSGFKPDLIIGVWRGGSPIAVVVHEYFSYMGHQADHFPIRAYSYTGIAKRENNVTVNGLDYVKSHCKNYQSILIVDDVFDTGITIKKIIDYISIIEPNLEIKIATPWLKPNNNKTDILPDYYIYKTDQWLVFPHELIGLSKGEIQKNKSELINFLSNLKSQ